MINKHFLHVDSVCVFRLNSSDAEGEPIYIQMVSALVLQLIQCVVHLPSDKDSEDDHRKVLVTHPTPVKLVLHFYYQHKLWCRLQAALTIWINPFIRLTTMCLSPTRMKLPDGRLRTSSLYSSRSQNILSIIYFCFMICVHVVLVVLSMCFCLVTTSQVWQ